MFIRAILAVSALWMFAAFNPALAASCSCAAVPLLSSMEPGSPDGGSWLLSSSYEFHEISDLVSGTDDVQDQTGRERQTQSLVLQASRGISERFSVSALLSAIEHKRTVGQSGTSTGRGIGDAMVMFKYTPSKIGVLERNGFAFGIGSRIPLGDDDEVDFVTLAEDMQPSTGAWGAVFWAQAARSFSRAAKAQVYSSLSYTVNFENDREYQFGDAWTLSLGGTYQTDSPWGFGVELHYRNADRDERSSVEIPNTGGEWLDFIPAIQYHFIDNLAGKISGRIPVWRDLNDALQFTTSYSIAMSISYVLPRSE